MTSEYEKAVERRARAIYEKTCEMNSTPFNWPPPFEHGHSFWFDMARATLEADEAAGYVPPYVQARISDLEAENRKLLADCAVKDEALRAAADALSKTAQWVFEDLGHEATGRGIEYDAEQARQALADNPGAALLEVVRAAGKYLGAEKHYWEVRETQARGFPGEVEASRYLGLVRGELERSLAALQGGDDAAE